MSHTGSRHRFSGSISCFPEISLLFLISNIVLFLNLPQCYAQSQKQLAQLIDNGGFIVEDSAANLRYREKDLFIPASTLKIVTSLAALEILGEDYRFKTLFFLDKQKNLYIKGFGDPLLTSEALSNIAEKLIQQGIKKISSIVLDDSSYALDSLADGAGRSANPYDAPNDALAVNFNSVPVFVAPDGTITSGEPQTPTIPLMAEIGRNLVPGHHRINVNVLLSLKSLSPSLRYAGELISTLFRAAGITIHNGFLQGSTPAALLPIYIHKSEKTVTEVVRNCLKYSNNYTANQLFLACGAKSYGYPATWNKSRRLLGDYARKRLGLSTEEFLLTEGSGLSRKNRISPSGLLAAVKLFQPYMQLLSREGDIYLKSGTLNNVFTYAGFFTLRERIFPFVIMLNQEENSRDILLTALHRTVISTVENMDSL
ncbi:MAG: D-alanyl-D-alanine carboxypeptidase [Deltaproteobacteria bacterium]|nr:D-alanyl-D-alanine carboxypeptidase [Deltaproteobacteria bacterium]